MVIIIGGSETFFIGRGENPAGRRVAHALRCAPILAEQRLGVTDLLREPAAMRKVGGYQTIDGGAEANPIRHIGEHIRGLDFKPRIEERPRLVNRRGAGMQVIIINQAFRCGIAPAGIDANHAARGGIARSQQRAGGISGPVCRTIGRETRRIGVGVHPGAAGIIELHQQRTVTVRRLKAGGSGGGAQPAVHLEKLAGGYGKTLFEQAVAGPISEHRHHIRPLMSVIGRQETAGVSAGIPVGDARPA